MSDAPRDANQVPSLLAVDDVTGLTRPVLTDADGNILIAASVVGGDVSGPVSSTDNAIVRWNGTAGDTIQNSGIIIDDSDNVTGVTSLVIDSTAGLDITPGSDTNADLITVNVTGTPTLAWSESGDIFTMSKGLTVTGTLNGTSQVLTPLIRPSADNGAFSINTRTYNASSGTQVPVTIAPTINQSGTAGYNALEVDVTETATGSGTKNLLALQVGNTDKFLVSNGGSVTALGTTIVLDSSGTATMAVDRGANSNFGLQVFRTAGVDEWIVGQLNDSTEKFVVRDAVNNVSVLSMVQGATPAITANGTWDFANAPTVSSVAVPTISSTSTLTNKRITKRTGTTTSSATPTINTDNVDFYSLTAQAAAITSFTTNLSGTPTAAQTLWIAITDDGTARGITWGASFEASGNVALPTTTVINTRLDVGFVWNTVTSKWRCVAVA